MLRRHPNLRVRTRIALTIFALSTGHLVLMSITVYLAFDEQLRASLDDTLALRAEANLQFVDSTTSPPTLFVAIEDDGSGIPNELATEFFQRFRRGDSSRQGGGTGLGLAIVAAIAHTHQGTISLVAGRNGRGARFEIELPEAPDATISRH